MKELQYSLPCTVKDKKDWLSFDIPILLTTKVRINIAAVFDKTGAVQFIREPLNKSG